VACEGLMTAYIGMYCIAPKKKNQDKSWTDFKV